MNVCNVKRTNLCFYSYETVINESNVDYPKGPYVL